VLSVVRDITERKTNENALFLANKKLTILSSITRHDIKNQLLALSGYLELSKTSLDNIPTTSEYIRKEIRITETLGRQIDLTKVYEDMGTADPFWQNINESIQRAVTSLPTRDVRVEVDRPDLEIYADPLFEKVFYNLIDNALKYGGESMTKIRISSRETRDGLILVCEDDGSGVPPGEKENIFNRKYFKNTGLGLFLSREILGMTGIGIRETGEPGKGARFEIHVPKKVYRFITGV
jgi:signal transduction histidine kinase